MAHDDDIAGSETGPEPSQVVDVAPQPAAGRYGVAARRNGLSVDITLTSANEYASIELFDSLVRSIKRGSLHLELNFPPS